MGEHAETYAAVDLGSNSFHLLVARREHGELRVLDRIKEMVRLAGGLDADGRLDPGTHARALECLARFGQRLRGVPPDNLRAVGTQALRRMQQANAFLMVAETALGCPVDIIAGREEARLIYLGVSQGVSGHEDRRLVVDIGGGSTELVIGEGLEPLEMESLQMGCVSMTQWHFPDGRISAERWERALAAAHAEMQELQMRYRQLGWDSAVGSSGTIRAVAAICEAQGWIEQAVTPDAVHRLRDRLIEIGDAATVSLPGLSDRRQPVIAGGAVLVQACIEALGIERLEVSPFALREGVLHDLLGRLEHRDPRDKTVRAFQARYGVDERQVQRMRQVAMAAFEQVRAACGLRAAHGEMLGWAADLHESGLGVSHSAYQAHSGYLVEHSDMAGFTRQEQQFLATLVRHHRRAIPQDFCDALPTRLHEPLRVTLACLRLAAVLCRTRDDAAIPRFRLHADDGRFDLHLPEDWARAHPLTMTDLEQERGVLAAIGLALELHTDTVPA